jgi:TIGR03009 family protein
MSRNLSVRRLLGLVLLGTLGTPSVALYAQDAAPADGGNPSAERVDRSQLTRPDFRAPGVDPNTGKPVDPKIEALLEEWSDRTKTIKRLQGRHWRMTRDFTFATETCAEGQFYVETPDKGRIDVIPFSGKLPKTMRRRAPNGQPVEMTVQKDTKEERWICDGKEIKAIDDSKKTYDAVKIPPNQQGANIMDGPLPFLFGMPPAKAKARYQFKILKEYSNAWAIQVRPNWRQDAVDWNQADVLLDKKTCLPIEVRLHNAAGTSETDYIFRDLQVNSIRILFWMNPFDPPLFTYKRSVHNTPGPGANPDPIASKKMPSVIGSDYQSVKSKLESLGYKVLLVRGDAATNPQQVFRVEEQQPPPNAPLDLKSTIVLTLYDRMAPRRQNLSPDQQQQNALPVNRTEDPAGPRTRTVAKPEDQ